MLKGASERVAYLQIDNDEWPSDDIRGHRYGDERRGGRCLSDSALGGVKDKDSEGLLMDFRNVNVATARSLDCMWPLVDFILRGKHLSRWT